MIKRYAAETAEGRGAHIDVPLSNLVIAAFQGTEDFVGPRLFPIVPVDKQSDKYYIIDPDSWLRIPDTKRSPKTRPNRINWKVSSDSYFADNWALAGENALEDLANADAALRLRENTTRVVTEGLLRDLEDRIARLVTSVSNVGSGVLLIGANKWNDFVSSDPIADVTTAHAFIRQKTGVVANTLVIDEDTYQIVRRHPVLLDLYKHTAGGLITDEQLRAVFQVDQVWRARGIKNNAVEAATASMTNIWGNAALLARVQPGIAPQTITFGLGFRWTPEGFPGPMAVERYNDPDPGKKSEIVQAAYYQDEKVVAKDLAYLIKDTL